MSDDYLALTLIRVIATMVRFGASLGLAIVTARGHGVTKIMLLASGNHDAQVAASLSAATQ